jgi:deazaflavin-dependent oxidoreductase (nitroreductase family)
MDSVSFQRAFARLHVALYQRSGGRVGRRLAGAPALVLTTIGRKSGQARATVLVYAVHGDDLVVVASNYGGDRPPAWLLNIRDQPRVSVLAGRRHGPATAREVTADDPAYPELWALVNANNHDRYTGYQQSTARPISLVAIMPDA